MYSIAFTIMISRTSMAIIAKPVSIVSRLNFPVTPTASSNIACLRQQKVFSRSMATVVPPVSQDPTSSKGPTAMVFMNMGGPSTTGEVGSFLSRLFVGLSLPL